MARYRSLKEFLVNQRPTINRLINVGGAFNNPYEFPLYYVDVNGAILFADLPGYSSFAKDASPEECVYLTNHFFGWIQTVTAHFNVGIIDKYIGDEVMIVYAFEMGINDPIGLSLETAKEMIDKDLFAFRPKIGIAEGKFAIAAVGTRDDFSVSAIGHTVNLAARCVSGIDANQIRIAAVNAKNALAVCFADRDKWELKGSQPQN